MALYDAPPLIASALYAHGVIIAVVTNDEIHASSKLRDYTQCRPAQVQFVLDRGLWRRAILLFDASNDLVDVRNAVLHQLH
jgi:hypothetical protein